MPSECTCVQLKYTRMPSECTCVQLKYTEMSSVSILGCPVYICMFSEYIVSFREHVYLCCFISVYQ